MKYRSNLHVPKPSSRIEQEKVSSTLFLREYSQIELHNPGYLRVFHPEVEYPQEIWAITDLQAIIAFEPLEIDSSVISTLLKGRIPVVLFNSVGNLLGRIEPSYEFRPDIVNAQSLITQEQSIKIMQSVTWSKLRRYRRFLMRNAKDRGIDVTQVSNALKELVNSVYRHDTVASLEGLIGQGQLLFYNALPKCFNNDWHFQGRHDNTPVPRMLDFVTKLLEESIKTAVLSVGLNPAQGYWHRSYRNQLGLIADFSAEFRLLAELAVIRVCNRGQVVPKDFDNCWEGGDLPKIAVRAIADSYEKKMSERFTYPHTQLNCSYQELLYLQAKQLTWFLCQEIDEYYSADLK